MDVKASWIRRPLSSAKLSAVSGFIETSAAYQMIRLQMKGTLGQYKRARGGYACLKHLLHCTSAA
jgi:hypothetical protein